jgi:hypothetical protein
MDRLAQLISKLNEQFAQNAGPDQLLLTIRQLQSEVEGLTSATGKTLGTSKVSVMMPASRRVTEVQETVISAPQSTVLTKEPEKKPAPEPVKKQETGGWLFDPMVETPTMAKQQSGKELNEAMAKPNSSLNDSLKAEVVEVGHLLNESPVRDLRKAIGINDKFVFINDLFRGDENMYERSIKTINGFRIFAEAEYWIERELKVKLGWDAEKEATRHFYQLIKRRFS